MAAMADAAPSRPRRRLAAAAAYLLALLWQPAARAENSPLETAVKATYLYKFAAFVVWPRGAIPPDAFHLCVVGGQPFGSVLDRAVKGQSVEGRPILVQRFATLSGNPDCQILYVASTGAQPPAQVLEAVRGKPVLTFTDAATEPNARGIVNLVLADDHVRFEIDDRQAAENRLTISSKLLTLALRVWPRAQ